MLTIYTEKETIRIPFPTAQYAKYLQAEGFTHESAMTPQQMKHIFQRAVSDFETGMNSTDAISAIAERLFGFLQQQSASDPEYIGLKDILDAAAELGFYIRLSEPAIFNAILRDVRSYAKE